MKNILSLVVVLSLLLAIIGCSDKKEESKIPAKEKSTDFSKRYGIKSGAIEYTLSGSQQGTKTLYFDDWGMKQSEHTISILSVGKFTKTMNLLNIIEGEFQYTINMDSKSGTKKRNPILKDIEELKYEKSFNEFGEQMLLKSGAVKIGEEKFLDKNCSVYEIKSAGTKMWIWKWLTIKSETISGGVNISLIANKIEENISVAAENFSIPKDAAIVEVDVDNLANKIREEKK